MTALATLVLISSLACTPAAGESVRPAPEPAAPATSQEALQDVPEAAVPLDDLHAPFDALLAGNVSAGRVDYSALKPREPELDAYLEALGAVDPDGLSRDARMAFWINAYNAFTLKLILERYPGLESIKDVPSGQRWRAERWTVRGRIYSLHAIEHEILRPMGDPRIHAAINCASRSCPDLAPLAYRAGTIDAQLDRAMRDFLADTSKGLRYGSEPGLVWGTNHRLYLSAVFDWFDDDFVKHSGTVVDYVLRYAPKDAVTFVGQHRPDLSVKYLDYDWSLNGS